MIYEFLVSKDGVGHPVRCVGCGTDKDEVFGLDADTIHEFGFIATTFLGIGTALVCWDCKDRFERECKKHGFRFKLVSRKDMEKLDYNFSDDHGETLTERELRRWVDENPSFFRHDNDLPKTEEDFENDKT